MKREEDDLDKKMRDFPRHKMSENSKKEIHDTVMKTRSARKAQKKKRKTKWAAVVASVAAVILLTVLGLSFFQGEVNHTADEEKGHLNHTSDNGNDAEDNEASDNDANENADNENDGENNDSTEEAVTNDDEAADPEPEEEQEAIREVSDKIVNALDERDMETVAGYVDPDKGLTFSPYVYVTDDAVTFDQEDVSSMLESDEELDWGDYDGKGTPIELSPAGYFDEFMDMDPYLEPDDVLVDDPQYRGNTENNIKDVFPDATVIEYYNDGSDEYGGIDWGSVNLVYDENDAGELQLVAIVRDMWTV